jgi:hypothetical protein
MAQPRQPILIQNPVQNPVPMTLTNLFQYVSFTAPILVIFFITLFSIMQNNIEKGLIFNIGIVILSFVVWIVKNVLKSKQNPNASPFCNVMPWPFAVVSSGGLVYDAPSLSIAILSFASAYLIYPMMNNNQQNYPLIVFLVAITTINAVVVGHQQCSNMMGIISGILIGVLLGIGYYCLLYISKQSNLVYFSDTVSNNVQCSRPSRQNFKCEVYKNGETISG